jgi:hypothetical protein
MRPNAVDDFRRPDNAPQREIYRQARAEAALYIVRADLVGSLRCMDEKRPAIARRPGTIFDVLDAVRRSDWPRFGGC